MSDNLQIEQRFLVSGHEKAVTSVKVSPGGAILASTGADKLVKLYNPSTGDVLKCIDSEHGGGLNDSVWLTNSHLVTACDDGMVRVWDVETNQLISTFSTLGIDRYPFSLAIHPRSRIITAGCTDGSILTFHTHVKTPLHSSLAHGQCITSCAYTSMGDELLTSSSEGLLRQWVPARNMLCMRSVVPSASDVPVVRASYDPTDQYILSTTLDHTHRIHRRHMLSSSQQHTTPSLLPSYDTHKPTHLSVYGGHTNVAYNVWSEVGYVGRHMRVWSGGDDGKMSIWNLKSSKILLTHKCHEGALLCGDMLSDSSASDTVVYTGGADGGVAKWSVFSNTEMSTE